MDDASPVGEGANAALAASYDALPYDPAVVDFVAIPRLAPLAALFGCGAQRGDVLDLGCGQGAQLAACAGQASGRLVGVDLSQTAIEAARRRLAPAGDRAEVFRADLMALTPERLGGFDVIYCLGVISFVPPAVRAQILALAGHCLNPGGIAVFSYYTGAAPLIRSALVRILTAGDDAGAPPGERVRRARALLADIRGRVAPHDRLLAAAFDHAETRDDVMFFHEMLNPASVSLATSELEAALRPHGVGFLGHHLPAPWAALARSRERAMAADIACLANGGYAFAVFGKGEAALGGPDPRTPRLAWSTRLRRGATDGADPGYAGPASYLDPALGAEATLRNPATQALVDAIGETPLTWDAAYAAANRRLLALTGQPDRAGEPSISGDLIALWAAGLAEPALATAAGPGG